MFNNLAIAFVIGALLALFCDSLLSQAVLVALSLLVVLCFVVSGFVFVFFVVVFLGWFVSCFWWVVLFWCFLVVSACRVLVGAYYCEC